MAEQEQLFTGTFSVYPVSQAFHVINDPPETITVGQPAQFTFGRRLSMPPVVGSPHLVTRCTQCSAKALVPCCVFAQPVRKQNARLGW